MNLHKQLAADTIALGDLEICRVLLMNNQRFPWLILVPRQDGLRELFDLAPQDYTIVMEEVRHTSQVFSTLTNADKMNVAALGNMVAQLHIHIIARFKNDLAWSQPVWSHNTKAEPYTQSKLREMHDKITRALGLHNITKM